MSAIDDAPLDEGGLDATELDILTTAVRQAASSRSGADLDAALDEIGWVDAVAVAPRAAVSALFEAQGEACTTSGALGRLLGTALGVPLAVGDTVLLPRFGGASPPARRSGGGTEVDGLGGPGLVGPGPAGARRVLLVATQPDGTGSAWATAPVTALRTQAVVGLDPDLGLLEVTSGQPLDVGDWSAIDGPGWDGAVALGRLAVGHELVGTMRTMLELARSHALDRVQFDRPIASFQAVRHRLAEALVAVEGAAAALDGAWEDRSPLAAAIAGAACGHGARTVRRHCQQVLAGIGFTTEHDLHRYVRRSIVLDGLFGNARTVTAELGARVLQDRSLPHLLPL